MNLHFDYPWVLAILIALVPLLWWRWRSEARPTMDFSRVDDVEALPTSLRRLLRHLPRALRLIALAALVIACARPQIHEDFSEDSVEGIDILPGARHERLDDGGRHERARDPRAPDADRDRAPQSLR